MRINGIDALEYTHEESWTVESAKRLSILLDEAGVDVLDVSSGGTMSHNRFEHVPGHQLPLAKESSACWSARPGPSERS